MNYEDFLQINNKKDYPVYMINGGEGYLTLNALKEIEKSLNLIYPDFNKVVISEESNKSALDIVSQCNISPFCDEKRLIIVNDYMNGKKNENDKKIFIKYIENSNPYTCLVFYSPVKSEFFVTFENKANNIECENISNILVRSIINERIKKDNILINSKAIEKLLEYTNFSITKIDVELKKLSTLKGSSEITEEDIENNVIKDIEYVIFDLTNAISNKQIDKVYSLIEVMIKNKEQPVSIISTISNHFRRLFYVARSDFDKKELADFLKVKEYAIVKYKEQASNFTLKKLKEIFDVCINVEYLAKNGKMEGKNAVSYLVANICK